MNRPHGQFALQCGHSPGLAQIVVSSDDIGDYDATSGYDAWCYVCEAWVQAARPSDP